MLSPLSGIRVLDLSRFYSGPHATLLLAGMGAEVIRIDEPAQPMAQAKAPPFAGAAGVAMTERSPDDLSIHYLKRNRAKKAITLNLKSAEGVALFRRLAAEADVVFENFTPGVADRLGIGYAALSAACPRLVYCALTGWGSTGPDAHEKSYDPIAQAAAGLMSITGRNGDPPLKAGSPLSDGIAGVHAALGVTAALVQRGVTGKGQFVDVSMADCLLSLVLDEPLDHYEALGLPAQQGNRIPRFSPFNTFRAADGWLVIGAATPGQWRTLCQCMGEPELADDPHWRDVAWRIAHNDAVEAKVSAWVSCLSVAEAVTTLRKAGGIAGPINGIEELKAWPHLAARGMLAPLHHPRAGAVPETVAAAFPLKFSGGHAGYAAPAPWPGQDNDAVYGDVLGLDAEERTRLKAEGVI
ncbi:MAG: CoA transferase [Alphaproteobacteria bacterium]|nr:CoA transferase [Alphaproteobacteria bacterium]MCB9929322.1 CoA transferase [Alphaproteobacteria bacterium]